MSPVTISQIKGDFKHFPKIARAYDHSVSGDVVSYTVPTDRSAKLMAASLHLRSGSPTVQLQLTRSAAIYILKSATADFVEAYGAGISLLAGDKISLTVSSTGTGTLDAMMSIEEYRTDLAE